MRPPYDTDTVVLRTSALLVMPALLFVGYLRFLLGVVGAAVRGRVRDATRRRRPGVSRSQVSLSLLSSRASSRESKTTGTNTASF